jgi:hypothetical protein
MNSGAPVDLKAFERSVARVANFFLLVLPALTVPRVLVFSEGIGIAIAGVFGLGIGIALKIAQWRFATDLRLAISIIESCLYLSGASMIPASVYAFWQDPRFPSGSGILIATPVFALALIIFLSIKVKIEEVKAQHLDVDVAVAEQSSLWSRLCRTTIIAKALSTTTQFDSQFVGNVARVAAIAGVIEFLFAAGLLATWVPPHSECWTQSAAGPRIDTAVMVTGGATLWTCIIAIFWNRFAPSKAMGWFGFYSVQPNTALFIAILACFVAFGLMPIIIIVRQCGP